MSSFYTHGQVKDAQEATGGVRRGVGVDFQGNASLTPPDSREGNNPSGNVASSKGGTDFHVYQTNHFAEVILRFGMQTLLDDLAMDPDPEGCGKLYFALTQARAEMKRKESTPLEARMMAAALLGARARECGRDMDAAAYKEVLDILQENKKPIVPPCEVEVDDGSDPEYS